MRMKLIPRLISAVLVVLASLPVYSQVSPAANRGGVPIVVGVGMSDFSIDWGPSRRMEGISAWVDFFPNRLPRVIQGLGIEAEGPPSRRLVVACNLDVASQRYLRPLAIVWRNRYCRVSRKQPHL